MFWLFNTFFFVILAPCNSLFDLVWGGGGGGADTGLAYGMAGSVGIPL